MSRVGLEEGLEGGENCAVYISAIILPYLLFDFFSYKKKLTFAIGLGN